MGEPRVPVHLNYGDGKGEWVAWKQSDVDTLVRQVEEGKRKRAEEMPDDAAALYAVFRGFLRLKELGWKNPIYAPKDGTPLQLLEPDSTGIHEGYRDAKGRFWITDTDVWPSRPMLYRLATTEPEGTP